MFAKWERICAVTVVAAVALGAAVLGRSDAAAPAAGRRHADHGHPDRPGARRLAGDAQLHRPRSARPGQHARPTSGPQRPVSGRRVDPVVPYQVSLPEGWRETDWWYQEGVGRILGGMHFVAQSEDATNLLPLQLP